MKGFLHRSVREVIGGMIAVRRRRYSVRGKLTLVVLLSTGIALLVAGIGMLSYDLGVYRRSWPADLGTQANILALATAPALAFNDSDVAERNLGALQARPAIRAAAVYDRNGKIYAQYVQANEQPPPEKMSETGLDVRLSGRRVEVSRPIVDQGQRLGTVYLRARYGVIGRVQAYLNIFGLVTLLSILIALALSSPLQKAFTGPLEEMADTAQQVVRRGDYALRVSKTTHDEIGTVIEAFNRMLDEVQSRTLALEQTNTALRASEQLYREADRNKDEFLATLAHELRNPLAPIRHAAKLLEAPALDEAQRQWAREVISRQVQRMALLLDDLLDVSRITRGRLELKKDYVELLALLNSAVETARPLIDGKRHTLRVRLPDAPLQLAVDPLRVSQALSNLLTNAAKYTDPGGQIDLEASLHDTELTIAVRDNGIGLGPGAMPRVFEMFSQVDSAIDRAEGGLGIGLALVKGLITLHGGSVDVHSDGPGQGSTFTLRLPRSAVIERAASAETTMTGTATNGRCRVLVTDDNFDAAESLAMVLRLEGHEVTVAHSGAKALEMAARDRPQVIILDIGMPGVNGYEAARRIRHEAWGRHTLLIALTGWGQEDDKIRAASAGFDHHLTKPVAPDAVQHLVQSYIAQRPASAV